MCPVLFVIATSTIRVVSIVVVLVLPVRVLSGFVVVIGHVTLLSFVLPLRPAGVHNTI